LIVKGQTEKEITYSINEKKISLIEIELTVDSLDFIEKVRNEGFSEIKLIPGNFMRTICIQNLNEISPMIDIYYALKNLTQEIKKIILLEDPCIPGINKKICIVEYNSHLYAKKALNFLNSIGSNNTSYSNQSNRNLSILFTDIPIDAVWCEPLVDTVKEILKKTPFAYFENLLINNYNLFEFKQYLEEKLAKGGVSNLKINKLRQFANKVMVELNMSIPAFLFDSPFIYNGILIPIVPAMRPNVNIGKYKDRHFKASIHFLNDEDKKLLLSRFGDEFSFYNESLKAKAESLYSKLLVEEKKEKIREREREREKEREKVKEKEKEKGKEREKDISTTIMTSMNLKRERDHRDKDDYSDRLKDIKNKDRKKDRKERERSEEKERLQKTNTTPNSNLVNTLQGNLNPLNANYLSQLTNLLINNPNSSVISNLQNLSVLGNLQNILSNPALVTVLQNLANTNTNPNINTQTNQINSQTNSSTPTQSKIIQQSIPSQPQTNTNNYPPSQINPIYNIPKSNIEQIYYQPNPNFPPKNFYQPTGTPQYPYQMGPELYMNQIPYGSGMGNMGTQMTNLPNMTMQPEYTINNPQESIEMDSNMMKKYYEYLQNMNK
jgi:hypothetical protein